MKNQPAFPCEYDEYLPLRNGMTLRDYFAAKAMNGIMMYSVEWISTNEPPSAETLALFKDMAQDCYAIADAMLKARCK